MTQEYRSLLDTQHKLASAHWQHHGEIRVISHYGETSGQQEQALKQLACMDLSPLPRYGLKGSDINSSLEERGLRVGAESNRAHLQSDGSLVARLAPAELLILADPLQARFAITPAAFPDHYGCYRVSRQDSHYWFAIFGESSSEMLAKLCGVDFNPSTFDNHQLAQTQVARTSAVVVRHDFRLNPAYYLLGDSSSITYMWQCLQAAMLEFEGQFIGMQALTHSEDHA